MSRKFQFSLRALLVMMTIGCFALQPVYWFLDCAFHGPYVVYFNERCEKIVKDQGLIGASPDTVMEALGAPTSFYETGRKGRFTLNYAPHPFLPFAKFQAHFTNGRLSSTELFDD